MQPLGHEETRRLLHEVDKIVHCYLRGEDAAVDLEVASAATRSRLFVLVPSPIHPLK